MKPNAAPGSLSLPVLSPTSPRLEQLQQRSRRVRAWRIGVLIGVHVLIGAHLLHWAIAGRTVGRFVLSDSMETLEAGRINPGFLLFSASILITVVGGRWLCGWACHMGALQEASAWLLKRFGIRPKLLRVRLLGYVPVALGIWMFVWPTFRRDVLMPGLGLLLPETAAGMRPSPPLPGFQAALISDDLWKGMPGVAIALPFLLVCGAATVYFLGARGFCRYGCPYGGVFAPLEQLSVARIKVDLDACDGCGRCTAACSSGIRVHEEVRAYGRVVSSRCIKTLDCVAACPRDALSFGLTVPAIGKKMRTENPTPKRVWDTTWAEELLVLAVFGLTFFVTRGLYGMIPALMSVGLAASLGGAAWFAWRAFRRPDVWLAGTQIKRGGRIRPSGIMFLGIGGLVTIVLAHSAMVRVMQWRGSMHDDRVMVTRGEVFSGQHPPPDTPDITEARQALRWYLLAGSWRSGGLGLTDTPAVQVRIAWLSLVVGNLDQAETTLTRLVYQSPDIEALHADLARVHLLRGDPLGAERRLTESLSAHPYFAQCRDMLAWRLAESGRLGSARALYDDHLKTHPDDASCHAGLGSFLLALGDWRQAQGAFEAAIRLEPSAVGPRLGLASAHLAGGNRAEAVAVLEQGARDLPHAASSLRRHAADLRP